MDSCNICNSRAGVTQDPLARVAGKSFGYASKQNCVAAAVLAVATLIILDGFPHDDMDPKVQSQCRELEPRILILNECDTAEEDPALHSQNKFERADARERLAALGKKCGRVYIDHPDYKAPRSTKERMDRFWFDSVLKCPQRNFRGSKPRYQFQEQGRVKY